MVGGALALYIARAQAPGITRADLQRNDLSVPRAQGVEALAFTFG